MSLSIKDYEAVLALAEERHFGRAARRLKVSQPALSSRLYRIEADLGVQLFERGPQGVRETVEGGALSEYARRVIDTHEEAQIKVREAHRGFGVALRIGTTQLAIHQVVIKVLRRFRTSYPEARVRLTESTTFQLERDLEQGKLDIAFLHPPLHVPGLSQRILHKTHVHLVDCAGSWKPGDNVVHYPRNEAPVMMGALERQVSDGEGEHIAIADTGITALTLSAAGYGAAFVTADLPDFGFNHSERRKSENLFELETSVAYRDSDRRPIVTAFLEGLSDAD